MASPRTDAFELGGTTIAGDDFGQMRARSTGHLFMVLVATACGLAGALGAVIFRFLIRLVQASFFEGVDGLANLFEEGVLAEAHDPLGVARELHWGWRLAIPAMGGLIVGPLIYFFAREAKGHGVPEVMAAVALRGGATLPVNGDASPGL